VVLEAEDQVGGLAKTEVRDGYRFDLGGHRFFTKSKEVDDLWHEVMKEEFLRRPRMSRIYWNRKFLDYPLNGPDVIKQLGPVELTRCLGSYLWAAMKPKGREDNFEQWVSNRFGKRLYNHFFKSYTEKVWGVPANEIRAEWAAQRIKGLSFFSAAKAAFFGNEGNKIKSLISEFHYPRFGPGQMWETMADEIIAHGGEVRLNAPVTKLEVRDGRIDAIEAAGDRIEPGQVISSLPLRATVGLSGAAAPGAVQAAAQGLRYRDFLTVALVIDGKDLFPDNWIYIHEPGVRVGRIQNYRSWSPWMVPDQSKACVGRQRGARVRHACAARLPDVRRRLLRPRRRHPRLAVRLLEPPAGRAQRTAPLQQLRSLHAHRHAGGREHPRGHPARPLGGQRRVGLPRGAPGARAALQARARDAVRARAPARRGLRLSERGGARASASACRRAAGEGRP
jgi:hypothetical protein